MLTGKIRIETDNKCIEKPMNTITKGFADFIRFLTATSNILKNPNNQNFSSLGSYKPSLCNLRAVNLISFDNSSFGYDRGIDQILPLAYLDSMISNINKLFEVNNTGFEFSEDPDGTLNISKKFKNISGSSYTIKRIFLNLMTLNADATTLTRADHFNELPNSGHLTIACDTANFTVNDSETVKITYKLKPYNINRNFRSFLRTYLSYIYNSIASLDTSLYLYNTANAKTSVASGNHISNTNNYLPNPTTGALAYTFYNSSSNDVLLIGSNNGADPNIDYKLLSQISSSLYSVSAVSFNTEYVKIGENVVCRYSIKKTFFNTSASPFTIGEVGVFVTTYLLHRVALDEPITVPAGQGYEIQFNFDCYVGGQADIKAIPCSGAGTAESPFLVESLQNLYWIAQNSDTWSKYITQTVNIDASSTRQWLFGTDKGSGFPNIGSQAVPFTGVYNGGGFSLTGMFIRSHFSDTDITFTTKSRSGLFSHVQNATIKNLTISNSYIESSGAFSGIFADLSNGSSFINCRSINNTMMISGSVSSYYGGIVGKNTGNSSFTDCRTTNLTFNTSFIDLNNVYLAGICGGSSTGIFSNCINDSITIYNKYNVALSSVYLSGICGVGLSPSSNQYIRCANYANLDYSVASLAGICSKTENSDVYMLCVNKGNLTNRLSSSSVAGIYCYHLSSTGLTVKRCYNSGTIKSAYSYCCGIGFNYNSTPNILDCINTGDVVRIGTGADYYPFAYKMGSLGTNCGRNLNTGRVYSSDGTIWQEAGNNIRGFAGVAPSGTITNYFDSEYTLQASGAGATPKTTAECKTQSTYTGWDFTNVWGINPAINNGYPYLREIVAFFPQ